MKFDWKLPALVIRTPSMSTMNVSSAPIMNMSISTKLAVSLPVEMTSSTQLEPPVSFNAKEANSSSLKNVSAVKVWSSVLTVPNASLSVLLGSLSIKKWSNVNISALNIAISVKHQKSVLSALKVMWFLQAKQHARNASWVAENAVRMIFQSAWSADRVSSKTMANVNNALWDA